MQENRRNQRKFLCFWETTEVARQFFSSVILDSTTLGWEMEFLFERHTFSQHEGHGSRVSWVLSLVGARWVCIFWMNKIKIIFWPNDNFDLKCPCFECWWNTNIQYLHRFPASKRSDSDHSGKRRWQDLFARNAVDFFPRKLTKNVKMEPVTSYKWVRCGPPPRNCGKWRFISGGDW